MPQKPKALIPESRQSPGPGPETKGPKDPIIRYSVFRIKGSFKGIYKDL